MDALNGGNVFTYRANYGWVYSVARSLDGRGIATGGIEVQEWQVMGLERAVGNMHIKLAIEQMRERLEATEAPKQQ